METDSDRVRKGAFVISWYLGVVMLAAALALSAGQVVGSPVTAQEADDWLLHVIPLPKEVTLEEKAEVEASRVAIVLASAQPTRLEEAAAEELTALFEERVQVPPRLTRQVRPEAWSIVLGVADENGLVAGRPVPELEDLRAVPNADQGYVIVPMAEEGLLLAATHPVGVYYAAKTLQHLLRPTFSGSGGQALVRIPLARIVDWPDLEERGQWGSIAGPIRGLRPIPEPDRIPRTIQTGIEWLAERKMNLWEDHGLTGKLYVTEQGQGEMELDTRLLDLGARYGMRVVPIMSHLDGGRGTNLLEVFPQVEGVSGGALAQRMPDLKVACAAAPETMQVIGDAMVSLAQQLPSHVRDINVWLTESWVRCYCDECLEGNWILEARAIRQGYQRAKQVRPDLRVRVLLSQGSFATNAEVIAELQPDIGVSYYHSSRTYTANREPMIYPLLEDFAASGGWLSVYPSLSANFAHVLPFSGPQFIRYRMQEFVDKGLQSVAGYVAAARVVSDFNITAAAEWSWNAYGRDERGFALAYFTQKGVSDPQKAADWAVMLGPVGWDIYGAHVPYHAFYDEGNPRNILHHLREHGRWPELGAGDYLTNAFFYIPTEEHLFDNLAACAAAMRLAREVGDPEMILETQVIEGYMRMLQGVYELSQTVGETPELTDEQAQAASRLLGELHQATNQTVTGLADLYELVAPGYNHRRVQGTMERTEHFTLGLSEYLSTRGVVDPVLELAPADEQDRPPAHGGDPWA